MIMVRVVRWSIVLWSASLFCQDVVFVRPFQDMFSEKLSTYGREGLYDWYHGYQSWSGFKQPFDCMRIAQVPFNTRGKLIEYDAETGEACIEFSHMGVDVAGNLRPCRFWTLSYVYVAQGAEYVMRPTFLLLSEQGRTKKRAAFPCAVDAADRATLRAHNTLVLCYPWCDPVTHAAYSAGTRFVRVAHKDTKDAFAVALYTSDTDAVAYTFVPHIYARPCDEKLSDAERRRIFNDVVKAWACHEDATITPYVWGGGVVMPAIENSGFELVEDCFFKRPVSYYVRQGVGMPAGVDCSSLVLLAAQIAGIECFYKTTSTFFKHAVPVTKYEDMHEGDLIVWPGHMLVISDMRPGHETCSESLGYGDGAGRVRRVALHEKFKDIHSFQDLWRAYKNKKPLEIFYAHNEKIAKTIPEFKIVSLFGKK